MNSEKLLDAIGNVDDDLIAEARSPVPRPHWLRWTAVAAALTILIYAAVNPLTKHHPANPTDTSALPLTPTLSVSGFEQGFVGDPSSVESPGTINESARFVSVSVTAKAVKTLPDTYHIIGDRNHRFRLVQMEVIRTLVGTCEVESFYYILPEAYMTDLTKYDALVITRMRQFGYEESILYNDTTNQLQVMDHVVLGFYTYMSGSVITAFTKGTFDNTLWFSSDVWTNKVGTRHSSPSASTLDAYEQHVRDLYSFGSEDVIYTHIEVKNQADAEALDYVKPFNNGIFIQEISMLSNRSATFRRYANGYPTNEKVVYFMPYGATYSKYQFTAEDLITLPDLASGLKAINAAYDAGQITPPHLKGWEEMRFVCYNIFGWYAKTSIGIYGIIRVSWCYSDDTEERPSDRIHYDDQYYIVQLNSDTPQHIDPEALIDLLDGSTEYVLGTNGYSENGRNPPKVLVYY